jgi:chemotaxis signal transduction protein
MTKVKIMSLAMTRSLLKQTNALANYLDEMLHDATLLAAESVDQCNKPIVKLEAIEFALISEVATGEVILKQKQVTEPDKVKGVDLLNIIDMAEHASKVESETSVDLKSHDDKSSHQLNINQFPIQCLMFRVGDNLLSIPLIEMVGVVQWTDELTQLPQSSEGVLGILKHRDTYLRVLDSLTVLGITARTIQKPGYVLILSDQKFAISCDTLENVVSLEYNDIQWHKAPGNNLMHGIIRESLAYLLSPSGIINSLEMSILSE